ncbi:MAG: RNA 2',3'-cyclic phosphodiesterase [Coriobacteriales bacterium]|jgi:2'-5' RNA ligase|nr:RNA 2',3'-cyclic phosphodiesterase [Coriobacteriales bacterium]
MRLFVAIDLPDEAKEELNRLTLELRRASCAGSFVPQENAHLTLVFIGETQRVNEAKAALQQVAASFRVHPGAPPDESFEINLLGIGSFKQRKGHTWWVGISEDAGLAYLKILQSEVATALANAGFELEKRFYKPHITLARSVKTTRLVHLEPAPLSVKVQEFILYRSHAEQGKQVYTPLAVFPFC